MKALFIALSVLASPLLCHSQVFVVIHVQRMTNGDIAVSMKTPEQAWWPPGTHTVERACTIIRDAWLHGATGQGHGIEVGIIADGARLKDYLPLLNAMAESEARQFELFYVAGSANGNIPKAIRDDMGKLLLIPAMADHKAAKSEPQQSAPPLSGTRGTPPAGAGAAPQIPNGEP